MSEFKAEQYLECAFRDSGQAVLETAYSDLHWVRGEYFLRAIFPCRIYQNKKYRFELPDCGSCNYVFTIVERGISSGKKKLIDKLKKDLSRYAELQIVVAASLLREILPELKWARKECLREIISLTLGKKGNGLFVDEAMDIRVVEFNWHSDRISLTTPTESKFPFPAKRLMKKRSREVYQLHLKQFFFPQQPEERSLLPRGWVDSGAVSFYFGLEQLKSESADDQKLERSSALVCEVEQLLSLVPHSVSIPLFSFALFSVLKYLYPGYPYRISMQDSYQYVKKKLSKILFLALDCNDQSYAQEVTELYCGAFLRYSLPGSPARDEESKYIHDGVLIVSERGKKPVSITEKTWILLLFATPVRYSSICPSLRVLRRSELWQR